MSVDRISNMVSSIKNASMIGKSSVVLPHTVACEAVAKVLLANNFLTEVKTFKEKGSSFKSLRLDIAYAGNGKAKIEDIKRVSKPGKRVYAGSEDLGPIVGGHGLTVVSTSRGLVTGSEAKKRKLGGEVILKVW